LCAKIKQDYKLAINSLIDSSSIHAVDYWSLVSNGPGSAAALKNHTVSHSFDL